MLRTRIAKASMPLIARRTFTYTPRAMAAGDTGSGFSRPGGAASGDAFTKREKGSEDMWIRQEEKAKLKALAEKVSNAQKHMEELQGYIKDLTKDEGGEKN